MPYVRMRVATGITGLGAVTAGQVVEVDEATAAHLARQTLAERVNVPALPGQGDDQASPGRDADSDVDAEQMTHSAEDDEPADGEEADNGEPEDVPERAVPGITRAQAGPLMPEDVQPGKPITAPPVGRSPAGTARPRGRPRKAR